MSILGGLFGKAGKFEKSLGDYEIFALPHLGAGKDLSPDQQAENLEFFLKVKPARCEMVISKLHDLGTNIPAPEAIEDYTSVSQALHDFNSTVLAHVKGMELICDREWRNRVPNGREGRIFSFVADLGIYCGTCVTHTDHGFDWRIDDTLYKPEDRMPTSGNVVISHISNVGPEPLRLFHDVIDWTVYRVADAALARAGKSLPMVNSFSFFDDLMGGRY